MLNVYAGMLKMMDRFDGDKLTIKYALDGDYSRLTNIYNLAEIAGRGNGFDRAVNLLEWLSAHTVHDGSYDNHVGDDPGALLEYAYDKGAECGINCRALSIILTDCLLAVGIKARTVYIMPFSPYDFDNHVVCEAYIDTLGKWVMLDPTYNIYLMDTAKKPLGIVEIRALLADCGEPVFSDSAHYNGEPIDKAELTEYYAKNMFCFIVNDGVDNLRIAPVGFDMKMQTLANIDFRIREFGSTEWLLDWRKNIEAATLIYAGLDILR